MGVSVVIPHLEIVEGARRTLKMSAGDAHPLREKKGSQGNRRLKEKRRIYVVRSSTVIVTELRMKGTCKK